MIFQHADKIMVKVEGSPLPLTQRLNKSHPLLNKSIYHAHYNFFMSKVMFVKNSFNKPG